MAITEPTTRVAAWGDAGTNLTEPSEALQHSGFVVGEKPSRTRTNWMLNWLDNAVQWILTSIAPDITSDVTVVGDGISVTKATAISLGGVKALLITVAGDGTHLSGSFTLAEDWWAYVPGNYQFVNLVSTNGSDQEFMWAVVTDISHGMSFTMHAVDISADWTINIAVITCPSAG